MKNINVNKTKVNFMKWVLFLLSLVIFLYACSIDPNGAIQQAVQYVIFLIATILFVGGATVEAIDSAVKSINK